MSGSGHMMISSCVLTYSVHSSDLFRILHPFGILDLKNRHESIIGRRQVFGGRYSMRPGSERRTLSSHPEGRKFRSLDDGSSFIRIADHGNHETAA